MTVVAVAQPSLLATVAHELRSPMSAMVTASEVLDRDFDVLGSEQKRGMISALHRRAVWMRELVENLLCGAQIRDGRLRIHPEPLDLVEVAEEARTVAEPLLAGKGQELTITVEPGMSFAVGDRQRISQALLNLVSNANRYADPATTVDIVIGGSSGVVRVSVCDRGPGVPPHTMRLFDAYERGDRSGGEGLGIGLWIVRSIVEAHGGTVGAENRRDGGATFWFEIPQEPLADD